MGFAIRGVLEGFYGPPWTWAERTAVARHCAALDMTHYVYAPKDDPLHRHQWRAPYGPDDLQGFSSLAGDGGLALGYAVSPGLDIRPNDPTDVAALTAKIDQVVAVGASLVLLAFDDLPVREGERASQRGAEHADLTNRVLDHVAGRATVALVPTDYAGTTSSRYLGALSAQLEADVPVGWTGPFVVNDTITAADAEARADALGGRPPLLWDNYPVNDAFMADRLFLGPLRGRDPRLADRCSGYLANVMVQPRCNALPLASVAAFCRGDEPEAAWRDAAEASGLTTLAEACDGAGPVALVRALVRALVASGRRRDVVGDAGEAGWGGDTGQSRQQAIDGLRHWLHAAAAVEAPGLGAEADGWVRQTVAEASVGLSALRLLDAVDTGQRTSAVAEAVLLGFTWPKLRHDAHTVMGPRLSVRPVFGQDDDGAWVFHRASVIEDANAIDHLVRVALDAAAPPSP